MDERSFARALGRGLGSAIVELRARGGSAHRDVLMRCCLRDISFDWQCEGTKGWYLHEAIVATGEPERYEGPIIERFLSRCAFRLSCQLADVLLGLAEDGSAAARDALWTKYERFAVRGGRLDPWIDEGSQWAQLAARLMRLDGLPALRRWATDAGRILLRDPTNENDAVDDLFFWDGAEDVFGERRVRAFIERTVKRSRYVRALVGAVEARREEWRRPMPEREPPTLEGFVRAVREELAGGIPRDASLWYEIRTIGGAFGFARSATEGELVELARIVLAEEDATVRSFLLRPFGLSLSRPHGRPLPAWPLDIAPLMDWAWSDDWRLSWAAIDCLTKSKDPRAHDLAVRLLEARGLGSHALDLIEAMWRRSDDVLIARLARRATGISHDAQLTIREIYRRHRSPAAGDILLAAYRKGPCALCRYYIVRAMHRQGALTDEIFEELQWDSYDETRAWARRICARRSRGA